MNGDEVLVADLDAHLDAQIVFEVWVPGASVADDITVFGFSESERSQKVWASGSKPRDL